MEQNLGQVLYCRPWDKLVWLDLKVSNMLSGLKNMALDMGDTIESQNTQIDRVTDKAQQNELRLDAANQRSENILQGKKKKKK